MCKLCVRQWRIFQEALTMLFCLLRGCPCSSITEITTRKNALLDHTVSLQNVTTQAEKQVTLVVEKHVSSRYS